MLINFHNNIYCNACTVRLLLFSLQQTNAQLYITRVSLYIIYSATCFDISLPPSVSFTFVLCSVTQIVTIEAVTITIT
jgi:hypothetical protein